MKEAKDRAALLRPLHTLESKIAKTCSIIKNELREVVTFRGEACLN
jgi:hypothetical protein